MTKILPSKTYTFLDLETSSPQFDADILQIAGLITDNNFNILESFDFLIKPKNLTKADPKVLSMINYNEKDWKNAFELEDILKKMYPKWANSSLIGWVSHFDWSRLEKAFYTMGLKDPFYYKIDVASMALAIFKDHLIKGEIAKLSLSKVCEYLGIERGREHNAYDDAFACYKIFLKILDIENTINQKFSEEIIIYTDGGALNNPGPAAIGVVIKTKDNYKEYSEYIGNATNNQAEYQAVIFALKKIKHLLGSERCQQAKVILNLDSELVGKQLKGEYKILEPELQKYFLEFWNLKFDFTKIDIHLIPREENKIADKLVKMALNSNKNLFN